MYDLEIQRSQVAYVAGAYGLDVLIDALDRRVTRQRGASPELYSVSLGWQSDPSITSLKAKGAKGDVLVKLI